MATAGTIWFGVTCQVGERAYVMGEMLSAVPAWGLVALGVLAVAQITLDVIALVDLYRRPVEQVVFANKWIWVAVVLLVSTFGAIIYLAAARKPEVSSENAARSSSRVRTEDVAESLYGPRDGTDQR